MTRHRIKKDRHSAESIRIIKGNYIVASMGTEVLCWVCMFAFKIIDNIDFQATTVSPEAKT